jgi:hypothetical protein
MFFSRKKNNSFFGYKSRHAEVGIARRYSFHKLTGKSCSESQGRPPRSGAEALKKAVVKSLAPAQPPAAAVKGKTRHQKKNLFPRKHTGNNPGQAGRGFRHSVSVEIHITVKTPDLMKNKIVSVYPRQKKVLSFPQNPPQKRPQVRLSRQGEKSGHPGKGRPEFPPGKSGADLRAFFLLPGVVQKRQPPLHFGTQPPLFAV